MIRDGGPFILYPDPRFGEKAEGRSVDDGLRAIGASLLAAAQAAGAYGLAAVHIGIVAPVVVISIGDPARRNYQILYNPRILASGGPERTGKEGSVSMPGIEVDVARPEDVRIAYDDEANTAQECALSGFAARVAQHEIDQMNGIYFLSRISRLKREAAIKRFSKLSRHMG